MESEHSGARPVERTQREAPAARFRRSVLTAVGGIGLAALVAACSASGEPPAASSSTTGSSPSSSTPARVPAAELTTVAEWPAGSFLEAVAVRADGSMLVTELNKKGLWYVPAPTTGTPVQPVLLHTFDQPPFHIAETSRDVFYVDTSNYLTTHDSYLQRVDLRAWRPGMPVSAEPVLKFPSPVSSVNGSALIAPTVMLVADSAIGLIWRVDLSADGKATARVWLKHLSMNPEPILHRGSPQPGINGVEYDSRTNYLYYTSTAKQLFMRVRVNPRTLGPESAPELVARGSMWDDFEIDRSAGVAYVTTHRQNTIERVPLDPHSDQAKRAVAGAPLDGRMIGPSDVAWGRGRGDAGSVAYLTTDGGYTAPPPGGVVGPARLLRIEGFSASAPTVAARAS